jgi:hypothetical protein
MRIAVALQTRSAAEWRRWMICYSRDLAASGDEGRLRELLGELLGPLRGGSAAGQEGGWQPQVLGLDKRSFLRNEVLREVGRTRQHQRLVNEYVELLNEAAAGEKPAAMQQ